ncbi:hypothetical protein ACHAAC_01795 [Aeromicrobium sp. CF4.19]|uniref:hypothetical protein n=1 Tax=Aeromicrobium sp. CF4.19 TaxID=3373082 RepID=UPI003EE66CB9
MAYEAPTINAADFGENEAVPAFILAAAPVLGVSAAYIVWVCDQCVRTDCNSFGNTVTAVRRWWGDGC